MGMNVAHKDVVADDGIDQSSLTSSGLTLNYNIGFGNFYIQPGVGMLSQEGIGIFGQDYSGSDMIMKLDLGMNFGNLSVYGQGMYGTSYLGTEETCTFINAGIKYNF